jgi:glycine cleavage system H protein
MPEPFRGRIPADRLYDPAHDMWALRLPDGRVRVGATAFGIHLAGELIMFTGKPRGAEVAAGRGLGTVETGKTILAVRSPVAVRALACNERAEESPEWIGRAPYDEGWLAEGEPVDWAADAARLVDAATYRQHVLGIDPLATIEE